jgi:hypothetical protein
LVLSELGLVDEQRGGGLDDGAPGLERFEPGLRSLGKGAKPLGLAFDTLIGVPLTIRRAKPGQNQDLGLDR